MIVENTIGFDYHINKFVSFICEKIDINPKSITISEYEGEDGNLGMCLDETQEDFIILVKSQGRPPIEVFTTIAHEMIHVKQYIKENLGWFLDNRGDIPYLERWWEKEAFSKSVKLVEEFVLKKL